VVLRNRDVEFPYRPESDFYYLTGFEEPAAVAVLVPGRAEGEFILFCRERDPKMELWTGTRHGPRGARAHFGAAEAHPIGAIDDILPGLLENRAKVYYTMGSNPDFDQRITEWLKGIRRKSRAGVHPPDEIVSLEHLLHEMRLFKSRSELVTMRRAAEISVAAHRRAMQACRPGMPEYQLEAELSHEFISRGARSHAYPPIIGGGGNACILHYTENDAMLADGDLVLIDAGAEYRGYAADITRTFPVNGRFSPAQRAVYELVLAAQHAAIAKVQPGNHWNDPHDAAVRVLTQGLVRLGLLKGAVRTLIRNRAYQRFFMHRTGHWLGMDVHDVGDYKIGDSWRLLEPGMVLTVEPGLYIPAGSRGVAKKWWNIGVRIEDDVLVTRGGNEVLTHGAPKTVAEIEALMAA
jgi:Xaa-Pro aminopeptidase